MENKPSQTGHDMKNIQKNTDENANGKPGTSLAEDTAMNKQQDTVSDHSGQKPSADPVSKTPDDKENPMDENERMGNNGL